MNEKCPVCEAECKNGATKCANCGFADELSIARVSRGAWTNAEDLNYWLETIVKPYRVQWKRQDESAFDHGRKQFDNKDYKKAIKGFTEVIKDCTKAIKLDPESAFSYACRGEAYRMKGQALARCGDVYRMKDQYEKAIDDLAEAVRLNPSNQRVRGRLQEIRAEKEAFLN
jgi:tetratricopeptide (TPR) repeat protein